MRRLTPLIIIALAILPRMTFAAAPDSLVKGNLSAVYYYASDGKRYVFPNLETYRSWYPDFSGITRISNAELAAMPLGGNVTYRPGIRMIKIQTDPKVYAVAKGGTLRWVSSESAAVSLYGQNWPSYIDDLSDAFFVNYHAGDTVNSIADFDPAQAALATPTIDADKGLVSPLPIQGNPNVDLWRSSALADINRLRAENGKGPVIMNALMNNTALIHSIDMARHNDFAHDGSLGETPDDRIRYGKVPDFSTGLFTIVPHPDKIIWTGENIGESTMYETGDTPQNTIAKIHTYFMNESVDQPDHRTTMLSTLQPYSEVGIGPYVDANNVMWLTEDYISH